MLLSFVSPLPVQSQSRVIAAVIVNQRCVRPCKRELKLNQTRSIPPICSSIPSTENTVGKEPSNFLVNDTILSDIVSKTRLANKALCRVYNSDDDGFNNESFFAKLIPLDGVPCLLLGVTNNGATFGGYTSHGFAGRDDYREATTENGLFVFSVRDEQVVFADQTDKVLYDFYDYAVRFGSALLGIPMNPDKHIMKKNVGTSSCVMPDGYTSVFGDSTLATIEKLEVIVAKEYVDELKQNEAKKEAGGGAVAGLFSNLFRKKF